MLLTEVERSEPLALSRGQRRVLETRFEATIRSTSSENLWTVTPGSIVGSIAVDGATIAVTPKIPVDRVVFMTAYAADPYNWQDDWVGVASSSGLVEGMARLFARSCERTIARGLLRSYRQVEGDESVVRGRVRWQRQARRVGPLPIAVRYQIHDDDILENQLVRSALVILRRLRYQETTIGSAIDRLWQMVSHVRVLPQPLSGFHRLKWTRQNEHYRPLLNLARVIVGNSTSEITLGQVSVSGFTLRLYSVFEQFVRVALRQSLGLSLDTFPDSWNGRGLSLAEQGGVPLLPDLGVREAHGWTFVGDAKYKRDTGQGKDSDLYQLLAYATATGLPDASLIYAHGPAEPRSHVVRHSGVRLHVHHLDLSQEPTEVLRQLKRIASAARVEGIGLASTGKGQTPS